jgi:hypothetical protein
MSYQNSNNSVKKDAEFNMALGWLAAAATAIASWAGLA